MFARAISVGDYRVSLIIGFLIILFCNFFYIITGWNMEFFSTCIQNIACRCLLLFRVIVRIKIVSISIPARRSNGI